MAYKPTLKHLSDERFFKSVAVNTNNIDVPEDMFNSWQETVDLLSEIVSLPAVLIMRASNEHLSVFSASNCTGNPFKRDHREALGQGLYSETVISEQKELHIPNALKDKNWNHNPSIKTGMIAYYGLPLTWPNKTPFGSLCMFDNKEREFTRSTRRLLSRFQAVINSNLASLYNNAKLLHLNEILEQKIHEQDLELTILNKKLIREIENRSVVEQSLDYYKNYDELTGLPNRPSFIQTLAHQLNEPSNESMYVIYLDIRNFKSVNHSYGYAFGDKLLQQFSLRIKHLLQRDALFARVAAAEFVIAQQGVPMKELPFLDAIVNHSNKPFSIDEFTVNVQSNVGVAIAPSDSNDPVELVQKAAAAMSINKTASTPYSFFTKLTQTKVEQRFLLESHLIDALKNEELFVHYQPLFDLKTNTVIGAEALLRWENPTLGNVPPDTFIALAEHSGQIIEIGNFVLNTALQQVSEWRTQNEDKTFKIAINISPRQFMDPDFANQIGNLLFLYKLPPETIELEITEGVLLQDEYVAKSVIDQLQALGVRISLDDFGTGYSSISYLQKYSFDTLKVDRCFISKLEESTQNRELTKAIISMGKILSLDVIAEGVETEKQDAFIRQANCDFGQGYLYGRPVSAQEFSSKYI